MLSLEKKWGTRGEIKQGTDGQLLSLHKCQPGVRGFIDNRMKRRLGFSCPEVHEKTENNHETDTSNSQ